MTKMKEAKIAPDAETLVCCLEAVARAGNKHKVDIHIYYILKEQFTKSIPMP